MSKLKEYLCIEAKTIEYKDSHGYRFTSATKSAPEACMEPVYLKSEADNVIAGLQSELEIKELEFSNLKEDALNTDKAREKWMQLAKKQAMELRHHKYKRCLAMAKWCRFWANYWETCEPSDCSMFIIKARYYRKWYKRWKKLAEKFKEAK